MFRNRVPRLSIRFLKEAMQLLHSLPHELSNAAACFPFGQQMGKPQQLRGTFLPEHRGNRRISQCPLFELIDNSPTGRQSNFQTKGPGHLAKQAVESADSETMQISQQMLQQLETFHSTQCRVTNESTKLLAFSGVLDCLGQSLDDSLQDFARGLPCESRGENSIGGYTSIQ